MEKEERERKEAQLNSSSYSYPSYPSYPSYTPQSQSQSQMPTQTQYPSLPYSHHRGYSPSAAPPPPTREAPPHPAMRFSLQSEVRYPHMGGQFPLDVRVGRPQIDGRYLSGIGVGEEEWESSASVSGFVLPEELRAGGPRDSAPAPTGTSDHHPLPPSSPPSGPQQYLLNFRSPLTAHMTTASSSATAPPSMLGAPIPSSQGGVAEQVDLPTFHRVLEQCTHLEGAMSKCRNDHKHQLADMEQKFLEAKESWNHQMEQLQARWDDEKTLWAEKEGQWETEKLRMEEAMRAKDREINLLRESLLGIRTAAASDGRTLQALQKENQALWKSIGDAEIHIPKDAVVVSKSGSKEDTKVGATSQSEPEPEKNTDDTQKQLFREIQRMSLLSEKMAHIVSTAKSLPSQG